MVQSFDFDKLIYRKPYRTVTARTIDTLTGIDTESDTSGKCFMICTSDGDELPPADVPRAFFSRTFRGGDFAVWNIKYDSGSFLQMLPPPVLRELKDKGRVKHEGYAYKYIPHKFLSISHGKNRVKFWDVMGFYHTSLERASRKYLNEGKDELETKSFTAPYISKNYDRILKYCIKDAVLTRRLGEHLLRSLDKLGLRPSSLYSVASVGFEYFKRESGIVDVWRYWEKYPELLRYACASYKGGKFEVTARGSFTGHEYDIKSAYPYEVARLPDIRLSYVQHSKRYVSHADFGFLKCVITNTVAVPTPSGLKKKYLTYYPVGKHEAYLTMPEYEYLTARGVQVDVRDGWYITCKDTTPYYRDVVSELFKQKERYKESEPLTSNLAKLILNSFYGKMVQVIEQPDGSLKAGSGWNPIYGAYITARTRIKVCEVQHEYGKDCLAVHTDSVILTRPMDAKYLGKGIGMYEHKKSGTGIIIMSGIYEIADKTANRCYDVPDGFTWKKLLEGSGNADTVELEERRVISWIEAVHRDNYELINRFIQVPKKLYLNREYKRAWTKRTTAKALLTGLEHSAPCFIWG